MKKILCFLLTLPLLAAAQTQMPNLLKDINVGAGNSGFGAFSAFPNNNIVFGVTSPSATAGLWTSDGSTAGTVRLKPFGGPNFTDYNGKKYFATNTPGYILWKTDGTLAGTDSIVVADLTSATAFTAYNNLLFFIGTSTLTGTEVWRTDGTAAGTFMAKDILPGNGSSITGVPKFLGVYNNSIYFVANDNVAGQELWKSDGTTAGTSLVMDIFPGSGGSFPGSGGTGTTIFSAGNNGVYFTANTAAAGTELWFSDGTTANTQLIRDVAVGTGTAIPSKMLFMGNYAYYHYDHAIYKSDGTSAGTTTLAISTPTSASTLQQEIEDAALNTYNNNIYFLYRTRTAPTSICTDSLYFCRTDLNLSSFNIVMKQKNSTIVSSSLVLDRFLVSNSHFIYSIRGGADYVSIFNPANNTSRQYTGDLDYGGSIGLVDEYQVYGNKLYFPFIKNQNQDYEEPCYLDLTNDSIYMIKDINPGGPSTECQNSTGVNHLYTLNGINYFLAYSSGYGMEFWQTDFTSAGTIMVKDINVGSNNFDYSGGGVPGYGPCNKFQGILTPNNLYFVANDNATGLELWSFINAANPVGIASNSFNSSEINVFPNPATAKATVHSTSEMQSLKLYNTMGALIKEETPASKKDHTIDLSNLANGVYFISIHTEKGTVTKKMIKSE